MVSKANVSQIFSNIPIFTLFTPIFTLLEGQILIFLVYVALLTPQLLRKQNSLLKYRSSQYSSQLFHSLFTSTSPQEQYSPLFSFLPQNTSLQSLNSAFSPHHIVQLSINLRTISCGFFETVARSATIRQQINSTFLLRKEK